ncbi:unnamed protein product, partial [Phaeothamnion confervicola]
YVADTRDIKIYLDIYAEEFPEAQPAHCVVGSWDFPLPQAAIEIDTVAIVGAQSSVVPDAALSACSGRVAGGIVADDHHYATSLPIDTDGKLVRSDTAGQTIAALNNLAAMLDAAGFNIRDICKLHVTIADIRDYELVAREFSRFFANAFPSWTVVGAPLQTPEFRIAIESIAIKGGGRPVSTPLSPWKPGQPAPAMLAGDLLFLSGQGGPDEDGMTVEQQARAAWQRIHGLIEAAGFADDSLLRTNNVLTDWRDFQGFNAGYGPNVAEPYVPRA